MHAHAHEGFGNLYFSQGVIFWMNVFCMLINPILLIENTKVHQVKPINPKRWVKLVLINATVGAICNFGQRPFSCNMHVFFTVLFFLNPMRYFI